jgi:hypothetical protein
LTRLCFIRFTERRDTLTREAISFCCVSSASWAWTLRRLLGGSATGMSTRSGTWKGVIRPGLVLKHESVEFESKLTGIPKKGERAYSFDRDCISELSRFRGLSVWRQNVPIRYFRSRNPRERIASELPWNAPRNARRNGHGTVHRSPHICSQQGLNDERARAQTWRAEPETQNVSYREPGTHR